MFLYEGPCPEKTGDAIKRHIDWTRLVIGHVVDRNDGQAIDLLNFSQGCAVGTALQLELGAPAVRFSVNLNSSGCAPWPHASRYITTAALTPRVLHEAGRSVASVLAGSTREVISGVSTLWGVVHTGAHRARRSLGGLINEAHGTVGYDNVGPLVEVNRRGANQAVFSMRDGLLRSAVSIENLVVTGFCPDDIVQIERGTHMSPFTNVAESRIVFDAFAGRDTPESTE